MRITFWGTRGSIARPGPTTTRYGGNTSCVEVRTDSGTLVVIDCGTGGHPLGQNLIAEGKRASHGNILISHTHWDHIQGLPFFAPLFSAGNAWDIYGPKGLSQSLRATLAAQMEHTYFPISMDQFGANITYHDLVEGTFSIGEVKITTRYLNHPALTLGYRLEADGASLAYCCDHEPHSAALASGQAPISGSDQRHGDFVAGADLVIHDAQYTAREYPGKVGWGHSPAEYAVRICRDASVKRLVLTHHDPLREDHEIDAIVDQTRLGLRTDGASLEVLAAAEGLSLEVVGEPNRSAWRGQNQFQAKTAIEAFFETRPVIIYMADGPTQQTLSKATSLECLTGRVLVDEKDLLRSVLEDRPSLVLIGHNPPRVDGHRIVRALRETEGRNAVQVPVVLVSEGAGGAALDRGAATDLLVAPFSLSYARTKIRAWVIRNACRWIRAQLPPDEERRLQALHALAILDTRPEERFDRVTRIASAALGVPIALVSLVDQDRQWFKSHHGLEAQETPRDAAICAHVVHQRTEMIVPDTLLDDRFADNPLVAGGPRIRFYAGAPLILDDGSCIGTFCVVDTRPRELSAADRVTLRDLRDLALAEIQRQPA